MREIKHLSIHQWLRSAILDSQQPTSPIGFLFLKLPPPPCAVLLVNKNNSKVEGFKATGKLRQRQPKTIFPRVSEATLVTFSGHFWDALGAKLGGVTAFRVVSIGRAVARYKLARLKASKRQESYRKGSQKNVFF